MQEIADNTMAIKTNYDLLAEEFHLVHRRYLTFGGFDEEDKSTEYVYLVDLNVLTQRVHHVIIHHFL